MLKYLKNAGRPMTNPIIALLNPYVKDPRATKKTMRKLYRVDPLAILKGVLRYGSADQCGNV